MDDLFVTIGGELKALGNGKVGGYLVRFGTPDMPDLTGDYFTADTDFDLDEGKGKATIFYHHGMDATIKRRKIGRGTLRTDDVGVWIEGQLSLRDEYEQAIYGLVEAGKMGLSSGTAPHLVERDAQPNGTHKITVWPLGPDASITPIPAEPRTSVIALKTYLDMAAPYVKALVPQDAAPQAASDDATEAAPAPDQSTETKSIGDYEMTNEEIQALIAQAAKDAADSATKAVMDQLKAEPPLNPAPVTVTKPAEVKSKPEGFRTLGEQLKAIAQASTPGGFVDRRLADYDETKAATGLNEGTPSQGGFLVQTDLAAGIFERMYEDGALLSRVLRVPVSGGANGTKMNAISETSRADGSRWGGVRAYWAAEAGTVTSTKPAFRQIELDLKKLMAIVYATDELIADAAQIQAIVNRIVPQEIRFKAEDAIINGTGAGQPLGLLNCDAKVSVAKETGQAAATVVYQNVLKMWNRMWAPSRSNAVWLIDQSVEPQLAQMSLPVGTGGVPVYMPAGGASAAPYGSLFGRPVIPVEYLQVAGTTGDIWFVDLSQYMMIEKGGIQADSSMHVQFLYGEQVFRFTYRVDGQPLWISALTPKSGGSTLSPFIKLDTRA